MEIHRQVYRACKIRIQDLPLADCWKAKIQIFLAKSGLFQDHCLHISVPEFHGNPFFVNLSGQAIHAIKQLNLKFSFVLRRGKQSSRSCPHRSVLTFVNTKDRADMHTGCVWYYSIIEHNNFNATSMHVKNTSKSIFFNYSICTEAHTIGTKLCQNGDPSLSEMGTLTIRQGDPKSICLQT